MKSKDPAEFMPYDWAQSGRPIQPYRLDPVVFADDREVAETQDPDLGLVDRITQPYLNEPIHAEIRKLRPGGGRELSQFAAQFGLHEFYEWAFAERDQDWDSSGSFTGFFNLLERYDSGYRRFAREELEDAWNSLPNGVVNLQTKALNDAFRLAKRHADDDDSTLAMRGVIERGWARDAFHIDIGIDDTSDTPIIYEYPRNIWSRAWFELVEDLRQGRFPKTCAHCGDHHIPRRRNRKYCSDRCRSLAYEKRRSSDPKHRETKHAQYLRRREVRRRESPPTKGRNEHN